MNDDINYFVYHVNYTERLSVQILYKYISVVLEKCKVSRYKRNQKISSSKNDIYNINMSAFN